MVTKNLERAIEQFKRERDTEIGDAGESRSVGAPGVEMEGDTSGTRNLSYNFMINVLDDQIEILNALEAKINSFADDHGIVEPKSKAKKAGDAPNGRPPHSAPFNARSEDPRKVPGGPVAGRPREAQVRDLRTMTSEELVGAHVRTLTPEDVISFAASVGFEPFLQASAMQITVGGRPYNVKFELVRRDDGAATYRLLATCRDQEEAAEVLTALRAGVMPAEDRNKILGSFEAGENKLDVRFGDANNSEAIAFAFLINLAKNHSLTIKGVEDIGSMSVGGLSGMRVRTLSPHDARVIADGSFRVLTSAVQAQITIDGQRYDVKFVPARGDNGSVVYHLLVPCHSQLVAQKIHEVLGRSYAVPKEFAEMHPDSRRVLGIFANSDALLVHFDAEVGSVAVATAFLEGLARSHELTLMENLRSATPRSVSTTMPNKPGGFFRGNNAKPDDPTNVPSGPVVSAEERARRDTLMAQVRTMLSEDNVVPPPSGYSPDKVGDVIKLAVEQESKPSEGVPTLERVLTAQLTDTEAKAPADTKWKLSRGRLIGVLRGALGNVISYGLGDEKPLEMTEPQGKLVDLVDALEAGGRWLVLDKQFREIYSRATRELGRSRNYSAMMAELAAVDEPSRKELEKIVDKGGSSPKRFAGFIADSFGHLHTPLRGFAMIDAGGKNLTQPDWSRSWVKEDKASGGEAGFLRKQGNEERVEALLRIIDETDFLEQYKENFVDSEADPAGRERQTARLEQLRVAVNDLREALKAKHVTPAAGVAAPAPVPPAAPRTVDPKAVSPPSDPEGKLETAARNIVWVKLDEGRKKPLTDALTAQLVPNEKMEFGAVRWRLSRERYAEIVAGALRDVSAREEGAERTKLLGELVELVDALEAKGLWLALDEGLYDEYTAASKKLGRKRNRVAILIDLSRQDTGGANIEIKKIVDKGYPGEKDFITVIRERMSQACVTLFSLVYAIDYERTERGDAALGWAGLWLEGEIMMTDQTARARAEGLVRIIEEGDVLGLWERNFKDESFFEKLPEMAAALKSALDANPANKAKVPEEGGQQ